jgi:hypothetical protein
VRQFWSHGWAKIQNPSLKPEDTVRTSLRTKFASVIAVATILLVGGTASAQNSNSADQQCSLAVVSRAPGNQVKVCDSSVVQEMARKGHVFEQNQMGIASVLAISPDYNVKEARGFSERPGEAMLRRK